jgi:hypothetical protein
LWIATLLLAAALMRMVQLACWPVSAAGTKAPRG